MPGPTGEEDPPTFVGALRFRGTGFEVWAGTNEGRLFGGPGAPTWAQVLASGRVTGGVGNNPHIDSGDILSFGDSGSLPVTGTIRSSTDIEMRAAGGLELTSDATMQLQAIGSIPIRLVTNATERLRIGGDGAWRIDGDEGTAGQILTSNGPGATPTWEDAPGGGAQGWDDVLAVDNNSGANNPHIDSGQFIGFGVEGSLPGSGQLRSSANWTAQITGVATLQGSTNAFLIGDSGLAQFAIVSGVARIRTSLTNRLEIGSAGGWTISGSEGSARNTLTSAGAGATPTWGDPVEVRDSGVDQGDVYVLDFVSGTNCNLAVSVASRVATITPSVDLSSVTYTAGDGIDLAANQFSADVSDFAGTGLEDDGANNLRIAAAAAGAGLTGGAGSALAVGAGTGITVNADDVAWSGLQARRNSGSFLTARRRFNFIEGSNISITVNSDAADDENEITVAVTGIAAPVATTGAVSIPAGGGASLFAGIRNNGGATTDRANLNFISSSTLQATLTDDAGNDEIEIAYSILADAVGNTQAANMPANTIKANPTGSSADPQDMVISGDSFPARVGGNLVSHPFSSLAGDSLSYSSGALAYAGTSNDVVLSGISGAQGVVNISSLVCGGRVAITAPAGAWSIAGFSAKPEGFWFVITASNTLQTGTVLNEASGATTDVRCPGHVNFSANRSMSGLVMYGAFGGATRWLFIPGALDPTELGFQVVKPLTVCRWHEDFECVNGTSATGPHHFGQTVWITTALSTSGAVVAVANEQHHPGIVSVQTDGNDNSVYCIHRGGPNADSPWVRGDEIKEFNVVCRLNTSGNLCAFFIGFSENVASLAITGTGNSHIAGFLHDSDTDSTVHCVTRESDGTAVNTDSNVTPGTGWRRYTIRQTTVGTIEFLIDGSVVATHTTQVPDSESMNCGITIVARSAAVAQMYVDYVDFESHPLSR